MHVVAVQHMFSCFHEKGFVSWRMLLYVDNYVRVLIISVCFHTTGDLSVSHYRHRQADKKINKKTFYGQGHDTQE